MSEREHRGMDPSEESPEDARVLRALVDELRAAPPPELDWDRIERGLVARIDERSSSKPVEPTGADLRPSVDPTGANPTPSVEPTGGNPTPSVEPTGGNPFSRRRRIASSLFVAVAAAAVLVISLRGGFFAEGSFTEGDAPPGEPAAANDLTAVPQVDGAYHVGAITPTTAIDSGDDPIRFTIPGVVSWTLAPQSRVVIDTVAVPHRVTLERGRIDAVVVPQDVVPIEERFAVIAGTTRVAVRGTIFSVERDETTVTVDVARGKVAVGATQPESDGAIELLIAPARAQFSLEGGRLLSRRADASAPRVDGATTEAPGDRPQPEGAAHHPDTSQPGTSQPDTSLGAPPSPPDQPTAPVPGSSEPPASVGDPARISVAAARSIVLGCLRQALASGSDEGPELTVSSAVTVTLGPQGRVDAVRFSPPLRPDLQQRCGGALFGQSLDAEGKASFHVAVSR